jgi:hypothetical protein
LYQSSVAVEFTQTYDVPIQLAVEYPLADVVNVLVAEYPYAVPLYAYVRNVYSVEADSPVSVAEIAPDEYVPATVVHVLPPSVLYCAPAAVIAAPPLAVTDPVIAAPSLVTLPAAFAVTVGATADTDPLTVTFTVVAPVLPTLTFALRLATTLSPVSFTYTVAPPAPSADAFVTVSGVVWYVPPDVRHTATPVGGVTVTASDRFAPVTVKLCAPPAVPYIVLPRFSVPGLTDSVGVPDTVPDAGDTLEQSPPFATTSHVYVAVVSTPVLTVTLVSVTVSPSSGHAGVSPPPPETDFLNSLG